MDEVKFSGLKLSCTDASVLTSVPEKLTFYRKIHFFEKFVKNCLRLQQVVQKLCSFWRFFFFFVVAYREFDDKNRSVEFHFLPLNKSQRFRCEQPCLDFASNLLVRKCKSKCNVKLLRVVVWKSPKILQKSQKYNITKFIVVILIVTAFLKSVSSLLLSPNLWQSTLFIPFT